ncbi:LytTR family transcriptional regulator DNA-binding domain-containing protein [Rhodohalobacter sp.]|uniref:LytTR family transcriptional regulator DNA-binding domain-containing protein n=1 Tax=Rhodohalobacter sp. TaxID=1974210 RepID=UPI002ACE2997|nr:LytTR family transcriptional regulator DNA-binding domain-containing protein [Rhodohalobacter sp.]MDZ7755775.1 LytTR family transcriptional regulator DNA-binding domain-containing protein [Rhodohalobacter sp.]
MMFSIRSLDFVLLVFLFGIISETVLAQPRQPVDFEGFRTALDEAQSDDEKLESYISFSFTEFRNIPDSLFKIAQEVEVLEPLSVSKKDAYRNFILAFAWRQSNSDSSRYYAQKASAQLKDLNSHLNYLRSLNLLGTEYARYGNTLNAEATFIQALDYQSEHSVTDYPEHFFYGNLGNIYSRVGAYDLAIEMYSRVLENTQRPSDRCNIQATLASNLAKVEDFDGAIERLTPCINEENLIPPIASIVRSNMSQILIDSGDINSGLEYLEQAADISYENRVPNMELAHQIRLGSLYLEQGLMDEAEEVEIRILGDRFRSGPPNILIDKHMFLARLNNLRSDYDDVLLHTNRAIALARQMNMTHLLKDVYSLQSGAYFGLDNLDDALKASNRQIELTSEISRKKEDQELANAKVRHQLIQYETELASSQLVLNDLSNRLGIVGSLLFLLSLGSGFLYYRYSNSKTERAHAIKKLSESEARRKELEQAIKKQKEIFQKKDTQIFVHISSNLMLAVEDIRYIQSDGNYVRIYLADENKPPILERCTLKHCESILPDDYFRKIHRSTIVNLLHVVQVEGDQLMLKDGTTLKMARRIKKEFFT